MFRLILIAIALCQTEFAEGETRSLFDVPLEVGQSIEADRIDDLVPSSIFSLTKDMTLDEVDEALPGYDLRKHPRVGRSSTDWANGQTPKQAYFEHLEIYWENGRLRNITLSSLRLPPAEGQLLRLGSEFKRLIGEPTEAFRILNYGKIRPDSLILEWAIGVDVLRLEFKRSDDHLDSRLTYYPGPENPGLARIRRIRNAQVPFESLDLLLREFIEVTGFFPPGDGPRSPIEVPKGERKMLEAYSGLRLRAISENRDWEMLWLPFRGRLEQALETNYASLDKRAMYERLIRIACGKVPGITSGAAQVGAAEFLATRDDPDTLEFLRRGLQVEIPSGVATGCAIGIGKYCSGPVMDQVISSLRDPSEGESAADILLALRTEDQVAELRKKARRESPEIRELIGFILSRIELPTDKK